MGAKVASCCMLATGSSIASEAHAMHNVLYTSAIKHSYDTDPLPAAMYTVLAMRKQDKS